MSEAKRPVLQLEAFPMKAAAWLNTHEGKTYHSVKLTKVYKDQASGKWEETPYLGSRDLPTAALLLQSLYVALEIKEREQKTAADHPPAQKEGDTVPF